MKLKLSKFIVTANSKWDYITFYINDIFHFQLPTGIKIATEAWIDKVNNSTKYVVQFVNAETGKVIILCEYDSLTKWKAILTAWDNLTNNKN